MREQNRCRRTNHDVMHDLMPKDRSQDPILEEAERPVFRRDGECWTIHYDGASCHLRDSRGLQIVALLLTRPGTPVPTVELVASLRVRRSRSRPTHADGERARVRATRAIRAALRKIEQHHPALARYLNATVRTGSSCVYVPEPHAATDDQSNF